ncbi:MAG: EamA family transporter [Proteobacteria bacterium]|nr:EamA family transporter [Pseudomonadota bacterium]
MSAWVLLTIGGAFLQNLRSLLQRRLTGDLSVNGAAYVRFLFALPFAWLFFATTSYLHDGGDFSFMPNGEFLLFIGAGAVAQMVATSALVAAVSGSHFALGTALSKTEAVQAAVLGLLILGEAVSLRALAGIGISLLGVVLLSGNIRPADLVQADRRVWFGVLAGTCLALCSICYRGASLALLNDIAVAAPMASSGFYQTLIVAAFTLAVAVTLQSVVMGAYLVLAEPGQIRQVMYQWQPALLVGLIAMVASVCWFTAMALHNAAMVRALGQIELLFTLATSVWLRHERITRREVIGIALLVLGILMLF